MWRIPRSAIILKPSAMPPHGSSWVKFRQAISARELEPILKGSSPSAGHVNSSASNSSLMDIVCLEAAEVLAAAAGVDNSLGDARATARVSPVVAGAAMRSSQFRGGSGLPARTVRSPDAAEYSTLAS